MPAFIYGLVDPNDASHIRYVGMATRISRPFSHANEARNQKSPPSYKLNWIRTLQVEGREPSVVVIEELAEGTSQSFLGFVESCYIKSLIEIGHRLTNLTPGGDGGATRTGHKNTDEHNARVSQSLLGHTVSIETRKVMRNKKLGKELSQFHRQHISDSLAGKERPYLIGNRNASGKRTDKTCNNISEALRGRELSESHKQHVSEGLVGIIRSDKTRALMSAWQKGKPKSEAHRAALRAALRAAWVKRKERK